MSAQASQYQATASQQQTQQPAAAFINLYIRNAGVPVDDDTHYIPLIIQNSNNKPCALPIEGLRRYCTETALQRIALGNGTTTDIRNLRHDQFVNKIHELFVKAQETGQRQIWNVSPIFAIGVALNTSSTKTQPDLSQVDDSWLNATF